MFKDNGMHRREPTAHRPLSATLTQELRPNLASQPNIQVRTADTIHHAEHKWIPQQKQHRPLSVFCHPRQPAISPFGTFKTFFLVVKVPFWISTRAPCEKLGKVRQGGLLDAVGCKYHIQPMCCRTEVHLPCTAKQKALGVNYRHDQFPAGVTKSHLHGNP